MSTEETTQVSSWNGNEPTLFAIGTSEARARTSQISVYPKNIVTFDF